MNLLVSPIGRFALAFILLTTGAIGTSIIGIVDDRSALAQDENSVQLYDYKVKPGDSCVGIANRELGDGKAYKTIHKYNRLGKTPHKLRPGSILRLPSGRRTPDAKIASTIGKVQFRKAEEPSWARAGFGQDLYRAWRVWSKRKSTAVVKFRDSSTVSLRADTILVIYGPAGQTSRKRIVRADLESGSLRSRLAKLENRLVVNTESSQIELTGGSSIITAKADTKTTTVSNHEGEKVVVRSKRKPRSRGVSVSPGKGTWVDLGKSPAPPRDLPSAPTVQSADSLAIGLAHQGVTIYGSFSSVPTAEKYRVEIAIDPLVRIVLASFELPKTVHSFTALGLPAGDYYLSVSAIDDKELESVPSPRVHVRGLALQVQTPNGDLIPSREKNSEKEVSTTHILALGSQLILPEGVQCRFGEAALSSGNLVVSTTGPQSLQCTDGEGRSSGVFKVAVPSPAIALSPNDKYIGGIPREKKVELEFRSETTVSPNAILKVQGEAGLLAKIVAVHSNSVIVSLVASSALGDRGTFRLYQVAAGVDVELAKLQVSILKNDGQVSPMSATADPEQEPTEEALTVSPTLGFFTSSFEDNANDEITPFTGLIASLMLGHHTSLELESLLGHSFSHENTFANNRLYAAWQTRGLNPWTLRLRTGISLWHNSHTNKRDLTEVGAAMGVGMGRDLGPGVLRIDIDGFLYGGVTGRLGTGLSYTLMID